jgi:hypothetical protein
VVRGSQIWYWPGIAGKGKEETMSLSFTDYEIPLLKALVELGGSTKTSDVYPVVERIMLSKLRRHPEEYGTYKRGETIWKNRTQWAREYLKRKGQLDASQRGVWEITQSGRERVRIFERTGKDPDEGLIKLHGIEPEIEETEEEPEEAFRRLEEIQLHETGDILGLRGIVYEPINEQGVILLFAALAYELDFRIEGIRTKFPDALLRRKNVKGRLKSCKAEFEYASSDFKTHGHDMKQCDLIICWEHDWKDCPIEVLCLKDAAKRFKG